MLELQHPVFSVPNDQNLTIWRYMDFTKYVSMLEHGDLYLSRADLLGDPFEGSISQQSTQSLRVAYLMRGTSPLDVDKIVAQLSASRQLERKRTYINCWHMNPFESAAMWQLYGKSGEAVAVTSSVGALSNCLMSSEPEQFYLGQVNYIDYQTDMIAQDNTFWPFVHKRKSFEHERELRIVHRCETRPDSPFGIWKAVSLDALVKGVYVSPTSPDWFKELVEKTTLRFGLRREVKMSSLGASPVF